MFLNFLMMLNMAWSPTKLCTSRHHTTCCSTFVVLQLYITFNFESYWSAVTMLLQTVMSSCNKSTYFQLWEALLILKLEVESIISSRINGTWYTTSAVCISGSVMIRFKHMLCIKWNRWRHMTTKNCFGDVHHSEEVYDNCRIQLSVIKIPLCCKDIECH